MKWNNEKALVCYFKFVPINAMIIQIDTKRIIDFQLPIESKIKKEDVELETFIQDLIQTGLVEKSRGIEYEKYKI